MRPAVYIIAEDVVAVDGEQGDLFRAQWNARYESSAPFRSLLARLDWLWGISGVSIAGAIIGIIFGVKNDSVGWAVGTVSPPSPTNINHPLLFQSHNHNTLARNPR